MAVAHRRWLFHKQCPSAYSIPDSFIQQACLFVPTVLWQQPLKYGPDPRLPKSQSEGLRGQIYFHNNPGNDALFSFSFSHKCVMEFSSASEASMELRF